MTEYINYDDLNSKMTLEKLAAEASKKTLKKELNEKKHDVINRLYDYIIFSSDELKNGNAINEEAMIKAIKLFIDNCYSYKLE